jgi:hypothetical protein
MPDMREVILGSPETAMDNEEQRERSFTVRKSELGELVGIIAISDPQVESR